MSHVDFMREASARTPGGAVEEGDGTFLYAGPHPLPMFVNGAIRTEPAVPAHRVVDRAQAFFRGRNRGFSVYALVGRDEDLIEAADRAGLTAFNDPAPLMVLNGSVPPSDLPADVRIEGVTKPKHVSDAAAVCADAYAVYGMQADVAPACLTTRTMLVPNMAAVVAYDPEGPVATASALVTRGVSYISWVGTAQRAMRRGLGDGVTRAATAAGNDLGADTTALLVSPMGAPVYRSMGFADVGRLASRVAMAPSRRRVRSEGAAGW